MSPSSPSPALSFHEMCSYSLNWISVTQGNEEAVGYDKRLKQCHCSKHNFIALCSVLCMYTFLFGDYELCSRKEMCNQKLWMFVHIIMVV